MIIWIGSIFVAFNSIHFWRTNDSIWCIEGKLGRKHDMIGSLGVQAKTGCNSWKYINCSGMGDCSSSFSTEHHLSQLLRELVSSLVAMLCEILWKRQWLVFPVAPLTGFQEIISCTFLFLPSMALCDIMGNCHAHALLFFSCFVLVCVKRLV